MMFKENMKINDEEFFFFLMFVFFLCFNREREKRRQGNHQDDYLTCLFINLLFILHLKIFFLIF